MIEGTFDVAIDTPKLHRRGTVALKSDGESIAALLTVGELPGIVLQGSCKDKDFELKGTQAFGDLGEVEYVAHGNVWGNSMTADCETSIGKVSVFGTRIASSAGEFKSSHDYIMSMASGDYDADAGTMFSGRFADGG